MSEIIGKVRLNLDWYNGEDGYSDGDIEKWLLEQVKIFDGSDGYADLIEQNPTWPVLYHLSEERENILSWYPFEKNAVVLEIGAGCGAVTGAMLSSCASVISLDLSRRRCLINAYRHSKSDNLEIIVANFEDAADNIDIRFDYITMIGVLEYSASYISGNDPFVKLLRKARDLLKPGGKILIAIENRLGLKYFAGCREDHLGILFRGIEGYREDDGVRTFSKKELTQLCNSAGFSGCRFFYPYPDYKFANAIYSDEHLPQKGSFECGLRNFDAERLILFDEGKAFDSLLDAGLFDEFSNSFFVEAEK